MKRHRPFSPFSQSLSEFEQNQISILDLEYLHFIEEFYADKVSNFYCLTTADIAAKLPFLRCITRAEELTQNEESFNKKNRIFVLGPVAEHIITSLLDFPRFTNTYLILNDVQYANATSINNHTLASARAIRILTEESTQLVPAAGYILMNCPSALLLNNEYLSQGNLFIVLTSQTTADTMAALPKTITHLYVTNLTLDQIRQLPEHIKSITITNMLDPKTIVAIPPQITEVHISDADATRVRAIPGHVPYIRLNSETTPAAAAAIPPADPGVYRNVYIQGATADAVAHLPAHIQAVWINDGTPLESIAAIPSTVTRVYIWAIDTAHIKAIPGHVLQIDLRSGTTADAAAAIPEASIGINRVVNLQNATENAVAKLPAHIKTVYINDNTSLGSIAAIPPTVTYVGIWGTDVTRTKAIPSHVEHIYFGVNVSTDMVAAIPRANPEIDRVISIGNASSAIVQQIPEHIKTVHFIDIPVTASILAIPDTVTKIQINPISQGILPNDACQNIIQLLNKRPDLICTTPSFMQSLNLFDQSTAHSIEIILGHSRLLYGISDLVSLPTLKENFTVLKECLQENRADTLGDPSLSFRTDISGDPSAALGTQRVTTENRLLAFLLVHLLHQPPSTENSALIKQYVTLLNEQQKTNLLNACSDTYTSTFANTFSASNITWQPLNFQSPNFESLNVKSIKNTIIDNFMDVKTIAAIPPDLTRVYIGDTDAVRIKAIPGHMEQIHFNSTTNPDAVAALPEANAGVTRIVHIRDASPDAVAKLPPHIKTVYINGKTPAGSVAVIPATVTRVFVWDADADRTKAIPGHITQIDLSADTPADAVAALPEANAGVTRKVHIHDASPDAVARLPAHIKTVYINNSTPLKSINAIPATVDRVPAWDANADQIKEIPGHIIQINLSAATTADAAAAIPKANDDINRIIHIQKAPADAVARLPAHIKIVYINNGTLLTSIAAIPTTVTQVLIWDANADLIKEIPGHVTNIGLNADTPADAVAALPQANAGINRTVHIYDAPADAIAQLPEHIKTIYLDEDAVAASILAIPKTVTHIQIGVEKNCTLPGGVCQNIIQLLNERSDLVCVTHSDFMDNLTLSDQDPTTAFKAILEQGTPIDILNFASKPSIKENLSALKECLQTEQSTRAEQPGDPSAAFGVDTSGDPLLSPGTDTSGDPSLSLRMTNSVLAYLLVRLLQQPSSTEHSATLMHYVNLLSDQQKANLLSAFNDTHMRADDVNTADMPQSSNASESSAPAASTSDPNPQSALASTPTSDPSSALASLLGEGYSMPLGQPQSPQQSSASQTSTDVDTNVEASTKPGEAPALQ